MKHKTELDSKFEYPENISFRDEQIRNLSICFGIAFLSVVLALVAICNADKIDLFFQNVYKFLSL